MKAIEGALEKGRLSPAREARGLAVATMEALVYHGPGKRDWEKRPRPQVRDATDAVVRITTSTICGTDLHILKGLPTGFECVQPERLVTHRFGLADVMKAYDTFANAAKERALKVILQSAWQRDSR